MSKMYLKRVSNGFIDPSNLPEIFHGDYSILRAKPYTVVIDQADFGNSWLKNKPTIQMRIDNNYYATHAIFRLTVCYASMEMNDKEHSKLIVSDIHDMCHGTSYVFKPLTIAQCDPYHFSDGFDKNDKDSICYAYDTMQTFIFLITHLRY